MKTIYIYHHGIFNDIGVQRDCLVFLLGRTIRKWVHLCTPYIICSSIAISNQMPFVFDCSQSYWRTNYQHYPMTMCRWQRKMVQQDDFKFYIKKRPQILHLLCNFEHVEKCIITEWEFHTNSSRNQGRQWVHFLSTKHIQITVLLR